MKKFKNYSLFLGFDYGNGTVDWNLSKQIEYRLNCLRYMKTTEPKPKKRNKKLNYNSESSFVKARWPRG